MNRTFASTLLVLASWVSVCSAGFEPTPTPSTAPIGSSFYRHVAYDFNLDLRELVKLEKRGFGRGELVTLVLISSTTGTSVKDYAKRRIKDKVLLKDLAREAGLDYPTLQKRAQVIKLDIEARPDETLPPPLFEPTPTPPQRRKKAKPTPTPQATPVPTP